MAREIKFRAWDFNAKQMQQVTALYFELYRLREIETLEHKGVYIRNFANPQEIIAMQYTGLTDKNGTEIYEGDVIKYESLYGDIGTEKVSFEDGMFCVSHLALAQLGSIEILGNIHENPELLEQK